MTRIFACRSPSRCLVVLPCLLTFIGCGPRRAAPDHCATVTPGTPLDSYLRATDGSTRWDTAAVRTDADGTLFDLRLVSQRWQGIEWEHHLLLYVPGDLPYPDAALLVLRDGSPGDADRGALRTISRATGTSSAMLFHLPNQPLLGGREEDALLAHTYSRFLHTGDASWPLLFPMVRSVVSAMDVMQALSGAEGRQRIDRYVVAGHSKRGHTAWLSGAADPRVAGVIALAIDVLNSPAQIAHHQEVAGEISASSQVFEETIQAAGTPRGRCLIEMIDPYTYRARLAEPKLIVLGTNDDYTPTDALNLYWDGLPGPKSVLYLPNTTHAGVNSHLDVNPTAFAFVRAVAARSAMPEMTWTLTQRDGVAELRVTASSPVRAARVWTSTSATRDFRPSTWSQAIMRADSGSGTSAPTTFVGEVTLAATGHTAIFGELEFLTGAMPFKLSTQIQVVDNGSRRP